MDQLSVLRDFPSHIILILFSLLLSACQSSIKTKSAIRKSTLSNAEVEGFEKTEYKTDTFRLTAYQRLSFPSSSQLTKATVTIYIEGDGQSWVTPTTISKNPTPLNPIALKLAIKDKSQNVVYLARPCQYTDHQQDEFCNPLVWTDERFSSKVVAAMNQAVDQIKQVTNVNKVHLVGYSGGGGLAVLMAAHRKDKDVLSIRTVAGDLDIVAMSTYHQATPTVNSLNPRDYAEKVRTIPQIHFVGEKDRVVPISVARGFISALSQNHPTSVSTVKLKILPEQNHHDGWSDVWITLLQEPFASPSLK